MAYEDTNKGYIEVLIENKNWKAAYSALLAYIDKKWRRLLGKELPSPH